MKFYEKIIDGNKPIRAIITYEDTVLYLYFDNKN